MNKFDGDGDVVMDDCDFVEEVKVPMGSASATHDKSIYPNMSKFFVPKPFTQHTDRFGQLTRFVEVTILELAQNLRQETLDKHRKPGDPETCPICMCDLYDEIETISDAKLNEIHNNQMAQKEEIPVVIMSKCTDHCFHRECLVN